MSVKIFDLQNGKEEIVTWFDKSHVQFHGGHSCSRKDVSRFYGDTTEIMLQNVQAIVDNYVKDMKKFDYPGKPPKSKAEKNKAEKNKAKKVKMYKNDYTLLCEKILFDLQPPESLTSELLRKNAGVWMQVDPQGKTITAKTPWVWRWDKYMADPVRQHTIPINTIREWIKVCQEHENAKQTQA